eukprot:539444_1
MEIGQFACQVIDRKKVPNARVLYEDLVLMNKVLSYIHHGLDIMEGITRSSTLSIVALLGFQTIFSNNNQNHLPIESSQNITALKECSERVLGFQSETADDMSITRVLMNTIFAVQ